MDNMNVVLDVSSIIWDEEDYNSHTYEYYILAESISSLFDKLEKEKSKVLISSELLDEMMANFPYGKMPYKNSDFEWQALNFLNRIDVTEYSDSVISNIVSYPNLIKSYFNQSTKDEILYLISKIHSDEESENIYFTFEYLWIGNNKLRTETGENSKEYETIISDKGNDLDNFFAKLKPTFDHNKKHDCESHKTRAAWEKCDTKKKFVSQLSSFKEKDNYKPQRILNKAIKSGSNYIGYDEENEGWVIFTCHKDNLYHGYNEYDDQDPEKIPYKVRKPFNK